MKRLLSLSDSADKLGVSYGTVRNWIEKGYIHAVHYPSGQRKIPDAEINRLLERMFAFAPLEEESNDQAPRRSRRELTEDEIEPAIQSQSAQ